MEPRAANATTLNQALGCSLTMWKSELMKTILQVEDDPNDVVFLKYALTKAGVANPLQVATDGQEAIDYLQGTGRFADREQFPLPCLILLDLKLPHVMGLDVLKWI